MHGLLFSKLLYWVPKKRNLFIFIFCGCTIYYPCRLNKIAMRDRRIDVPFFFRATSRCIFCYHFLSVQPQVGKQIYILLSYLIYAFSSYYFVFSTFILFTYDGLSEFLIICVFSIASLPYCFSISPLLNIFMYACSAPICTIYFPCNLNV